MSTTGGLVHMIGMMGLMLLLPVVVIVAIVAGIVGALQQLGPRRAAADGPLAVLDERFARGEIDHEEYETRRRALLASRR
jgi:putative membrane protein